jgi:hypothetical protein
LLEAPAGGLFWNVPEFGRRTRFDAHNGFETCPLEAHFQSRKQPKVTQSENRRLQWFGDEKTNFRPGIDASQAKRGSVRYRDTETVVLATCSAASSELHLATSAKLAHRNAW